MIDRDFEIDFRPVFDYWGRASFAPEYVERAKYRTRDLSRDEMLQLCNLLIDNCERLPSIVKVVGFSGQVRAMRPQVVDLIPKQSMKCPACGDLGIVAAFLPKEKIETLVLCPCDAGREEKFWKLPNITRPIESAFVLSRCPLHWFKPEGPNPGSVMTAIYPKMEAWKERVHIAEQFWQHHNSEQTWGVVF